VRWPVTVTSQTREYNVDPGGRAFDTITVSGFPANHTDFAGDGYWNADASELTNTVYGPFDTDTVLTDALDLSTAPVLTSVTVAAKNGVYRIGYTDADAIKPTKPGFYVIVTTFVGDDRVQPFQSSPADILERFYVPGPTPPPLTVITQATPTVAVGDPLADTALVQGETPDGAYLVFRAYGPVADGGQPDWTKPFFESEQVAVTGAGFYTSPATTVDQAGSVFWVETLYDKDGTVLVEGKQGAPGETTTVTPPPPMIVTTKAVPEVEFGKPAHDTAIVTGTVPKGAMLTFTAYRQPDVVTDTQDAVVCTTAELVFTSKPVAVTGPGEIDSENVVFADAGRYFWVETVTGPNGDVLHQGTCGAPGETTVVSPPPPPTVTTKAVAEVELGKPAHDTATVKGIVPDGATIVFRAYQQPASADGKNNAAVCTSAELVFTSKPVTVSGEGDFDSEQVTFKEAGTYLWVETLYSPGGDVLHEGKCGTPGETTIVKAAPTPTPPPPGPRVDTGGSLATTGGSGWMWPVGIIGALMLTFTGLVLVFGRRLAQRRGAEGYVREEDRLN
jgi:hypothetical protein